jgi:1D-myo-inositol 3-kinase
MEQTAVPHYTKQPKLLANPMYEEPIQRVEWKPPWSGRI